MDITDLQKSASIIANNYMPTYWKIQKKIDRFLDTYNHTKWGTVKGISTKIQ